MSPLAAFEWTERGDAAREASAVPCVAKLLGRMRTFETNDLGDRIHDGRVGGDGSSQHIVLLVQVDNDDLVLFAHFLPDADELVRLHRERVEANVGGIDAERLELSPCGHGRHE